MRDFHAFISGSTRSVMELIVSADTRLPRFSSIQSLISRVLLPRAYRPIIRSATPSARMVSRFLINCGSKLELRSRGVDTVTSPNGVWTCFCIFPLRRLPIWRSSSVRCASISPSRAAFRILSNKGAKAPSLPNKGLPAFSCSIALFLILSKSNSSFIKKLC